LEASFGKTKPQRDEEREHRITMEIVVDCSDEHERAMGWDGRYADPHKQ